MWNVTPYPGYISCDDCPSLGKCVFLSVWECVCVPAATTGLILANWSLNVSADTPPPAYMPPDEQLGQESQSMETSSPLVAPNMPRGGKDKRIMRRWHYSDNITAGEIPTRKYILKVYGSQRPLTEGTTWLRWKIAGKMFPLVSAYLLVHLNSIHYSWWCIPVKIKPDFCFELPYSSAKALRSQCCTTEKLTIQFPILYKNNLRISSSPIK